MPKLVKTILAVTYGTMEWVVLLAGTYTSNPWPWYRSLLLLGSHDKFWLNYYPGCRIFFFQNLFHLAEHHRRQTGNSGVDVVWITFLSVFRHCVASVSDVRKMNFVPYVSWKTEAKNCELFFCCQRGRKKILIITINNCQRQVGISDGFLFLHFGASERCWWFRRFTGD